MNKYNQNLDKNDANFVPLTPLSFLERAKDIYPDYVGIVYEDRSYTWSEIYKRCIKFASALEKIGIGEGDTVSVMACNTPEIFEAHYSVPMTGGILNTINIRLDAKTVSYILDHSEAKVLIVDRQFHAVVNKALETAKNKPLIIDIQDNFADQSLLKKIGEKEYEEFLNTGDENFQWKRPKDEWQAISLSYTSGTTGNPKGVVYHHRGAYLNAIGNTLVWEMPMFPKYLWTLPMFHCNGWCFPWTVTERAGTHVCLRQPAGELIVNALIKHKVSHLSGAPIIMQMIADHLISNNIDLTQEIKMMTAGAPPPEAVLGKMKSCGIDVIHVYGLTETYGPSVVCAWKTEWNNLSPDEQAKMKARQGVPYSVQEDIKIVDPKTLKNVPQDGETIGEVFTRGNITMRGYLKNEKATKESFEDGWFHTGDLGVWHEDGYIQLKDRSKDIIISGGENISSIEVEDALYKHPDVVAVGVVAKHDEKWGETPCAFVELREGSKVTSDELKIHCKNILAGFKVPSEFQFIEIPKTSTGKIQKFKLRELIK